MSKTLFNTVSAIALLALCSTSHAFAADDATVSKLSKMIEQQQKVLEQQSKELNAMRQELNSMHTTTQQVSAGNVTTAPVVDSKHIPPVTEARPSTPGKPKVADANLPTERKYIEEGSFPGSIRIPGTAASFKIGGQVKMDTMYTPNQTPGLSEDTFFTRSIQSNSPTKAGRTRLQARDTRLNFDLRSPTPYGDLKMFTEFDLFGASGSTTPQSQFNGYDFRLRHAYVQVGHFIAGQTWSNFNDTASFAETLDFGQVNGEAFTRQPQLRYTTDKHENFTFAASVENPEGDISDNTAPGVGRRANADTLPDVIGSVSLDKDWGHLQSSALYRRLKVEDSTVAPGFSDSTNGYGVNFSGKIKTPLINEKDTVRFQANYGDGIGRYINDLQNIGTESYDAAVDGTNNHIQSLKAFGGYTSYQAVFSDRWRSNLTGGYVHIDQPSFQPGTELQSTAYVAANVIWSPVSKLDVGFETLWGYRENINDTSGNAVRFISSVKYSF